ncbi:FAD-binding protein [Allokutzneria albata]|uniref:FAD/FMN-containing dehydrogenase n=1 Tax=Allokutzneria albata TaxID=211114 RepID=A0A1G9SG19_ALLAB|nr:FAD-binding protein [Allokutzneria albata]SDM34352.1 FAD/FMN-containing dehydrogenase [Allokutzneria albata]
MTQQPLFWDPTSRDWTTEAGDGTVELPQVDGEFVFDGDALTEASRDLGRIVTRRPAAVLRPSNAEDVAKVVRFCHDHRIPVAPQGTGHMTQGQRLVEGGIAIDVTALNTVHECGPDKADVDGGVLWSDLVSALAGKGTRFSGGLTGYLPITVGGTLSAGGIGPGYRYGAQVDSVSRVQVVTGRGEVEWASETELPDLFDAVLGGIGQVGVITRAELKVAPLPATVRSWVLPYVEPAAAFRAMREVVARGQVDEIYCIIAPPGAVAPVPTFLVHLAHYDHGTGVPEGLLDGLDPQGPVQEEQLDYVAQVSKYSAVMDQWRTEDWDERHKPWFDVFLADEHIESFAAETFALMTEDDWSLPHGRGFVLVFPHRAGSFRRPRLRMPEQEPDGLIWLFDVLNASPIDPAPDFIEKMLERNKVWMDKVRSLGGKTYPIGGQRYGPDEWREHYGDTWDDVVRAKKLYDPARILTPGPGINAALP